MKTYQLDKEIAEKWVAALRSGEYKQGIGVLYNKRNNTFCSLGVLGAVCGNDLKDMTSMGILSSIIDNKVPNHIMKQLNGNSPTSITLSGRLINLNDRTKKSFCEIADWIEENVEFV